MAVHKAVHVESAGAALTLVEVETTPPPPGHLRIAVAASGVCGTIAGIGDGVDGFAVGDRVAVGWFGGNCNRCVPCRKGYFMQCVNLQVPSWQYPGGYAESVVVPATAPARIPDGLSF